MEQRISDVCTSRLNLVHIAVMLTVNLLVIVVFSKKNRFRSNVCTFSSLKSENHDYQ